LPANIVDQITSKADRKKPTRSVQHIAQDHLPNRRTHQREGNDQDQDERQEEETVSKRMDKEEYSPSGGDDKEEDDDNKLESYGDDDDDNELDRRFRQAKAEAAAEALADPSPSTGHCTDNYGHSQQSYLQQKNYHRTRCISPANVKNTRKKIP
jgi:hypothetical protein